MRHAYACGSVYGASRPAHPCHLLRACSAVAKEFLDAGLETLNNLPLVTFLRDSIATAVTQVVSLVSDASMAALVEFKPKVRTLQDKVLPIVTNVTNVLDKIAGVLTRGGEILDMVLEPASKLGQAADVLDNLDTLMGALVGEEVTVEDLLATATSVSTLAGSSGTGGGAGTDVSTFVNMTSQAGVIWDKATALIDMLGFKGIEEIGANPVGAMRSAVTQFIERVRARVAVLP